MRHWKTFLLTNVQGYTALMCKDVLEMLCNLTSHDLLAIGENLTMVAKVIAVLSLTMTVSLPYAYHR